MEDTALFTIFPILGVTKEENTVTISIRFIGYEILGPPDERLAILNDEGIEGYPLFKDEDDNIIAGIQRKNYTYVSFSSAFLTDDDNLSHVVFSATEEVYPVIKHAFACAKQYNLVAAFFRLIEEIAKKGIEITSEGYDENYQYSLTMKMLDLMFEDTEDEDVYLLYHVLKRNILTDETLVQEFTGMFVNMGITTTSLIPTST